MLSAPTERRAWVIYELALRGTSLADVARRHGVTRQCIYAAFRKPYPKMEQLIAEAMGLTVEQLWPERYAQGPAQTLVCLHDNTEADKAQERCATAARRPFSR